MMTTFSIHVKADKRDDKGRTALHLAVRQNHIEAIKALIDLNANINERIMMSDFTALHIAAIKLLIKAGADINRFDSST